MSIIVVVLHSRHLGAKDAIQRPSDDNDDPAPPVPIPEQTSGAPGEPSAAARPARVVGPFARDHAVVVSYITDELLLCVCEGFGERRRYRGRRRGQGVEVLDEISGFLHRHFGRGGEGLALDVGGVAEGEGAVPDLVGGFVGRAWWLLKDAELVIGEDALEALFVDLDIEVLDQWHVFVPSGPNEHAVWDTSFVFDVEGVFVDVLDARVGRDVHVACFQLAGGVVVQLCVVG